MRYDRFLRLLEQVKARYEQEIRKIVHDMTQEDAEVTRAILRKPATTKPEKSPPALAWTPERRAKQSRLMKARMRARRKAKEGA